MIPTDWQEYLKGLIGEYDAKDVESIVFLTSKLIKISCHNAASSASFISAERYE